MKNTFIKTIRETEDGVSFIVDDDVSNEDFYYKLIWEENSIKLVVGEMKKMSIIFYLVYFLGLVLFIFFSSKAVVESKKYLILAFFGLFTMIGTMMGFIYKLS